ncbi:MAG: phosphoribosylformylglycinamidine synthase [Massiliimalia sp.]|jgi:phosphoribosylformylglycinamidine synthase
MSVFRVYVEKKEEFAVEANHVLSDIHTALSISALEKVRLLNRYDVEGVTEEVFSAVTTTILSEPAVDVTYAELPEEPEAKVFAIEYLPGQFDQRADSAAQCISLLTQDKRPLVKNARVYFLYGDLSQEEFDRIKSYLINPVESREASLAKLDTLNVQYDTPTTVETLNGFIGLDEAGLADFVSSYGLAMDLDDIKFCQAYFKNTEKRDPTITEIRMIDTYWSDHCRHTTFSTNIDNVTIDDPFIAETYEEYLSARKALGREQKPVTLMDLATIGARQLKKDGLLKDLDESEEINACSVKIKVKVNDEKNGSEEQDWLLMFKNETHNHPTEIEPFGGAATCLGGAIRDPLSGRSYVYQAMRVTGAADPLLPVEETMEGKLPQRKITVGAANGYSSYGNQIGLATGHVAEIYHPGYAAKRMEIGAVVGAAPMENVIREVPEPGDVVVLLGGKTGRDGCGGATGSSKSHTIESIESCGSEVQKGNPPEERKLQRLFRKKEVTNMIRRCNDFGAGGVSVAIGELADGLAINLDAVPKKYDGLDGTELAISESQERMACVVREKDVAAFMAAADQENIEATVVAVVTEEPRLRMNWLGNEIVNLSREFLNSNGAEKHTDIHITAQSVKPVYKYDHVLDAWYQHMTNLNLCSQKGLVERFDSTIGAGTVLMPFGGENQLTPTQAMVAKIPVLKGQTDTSSVMAWGFNPYISEQSPYLGAVYAVIESIAKVISVGGSYHQCWLTFQEYFERTQNTPERWGQPMAALLGAYKAQIEMGIGSIGGKDSMSGTFEHIDVPPTLVSFAVSVADANKVISQEFKDSGHAIALILPKYKENGMPDFDSVKQVFDKVEQLIAEEKVAACFALTGGGVGEALAKMALGNHIGAKVEENISSELLFNGVYGGFVLELNDQCGDVDGLQIIGHTTSKYILVSPTFEYIQMHDLQEKYEKVLEPIFPCNIKTTDKKINTITYHHQGERKAPAIKTAKPRVLIPVFPGTNCEYDTARVFERAGAETNVFVIRNQNSAQIEESVQAFYKAIEQSQIIMIPGGFSGGDEPEGSGKFITSFFRNPAIKDGVHELLNHRDGLMLGICNGFQALVKLGLVPYGEIVDMEDNAPTLTFNTIGRHQSMMVHTRICSNKSPWLANVNVGDIHTIAISHGEGRFVAEKDLLRKMADNGQIATQYVDLNGDPTYDIRFNPNTSIMAIEGITSPDGRVFGKMGHSERIGTNVCKNVPGDKDQHIFRSGVEYFTK